MVSKLFKIFILIFINNFLKGTRFFKLKTFLIRLIGFRVGQNTKIVGPVKVGTCAKLSIGDNCWIGANLTVHGNGNVTIGSNCDLAPDITFLTGTHEIGGPLRRAGIGKSTRIVVGNGCWLGANSTYLGDLVINNSSIIGACSFVNKDVMGNSIYAGNPAKKIKVLD